MADIDLHKLANEGGYGAAQKALKEAGFWDEKRAVDEGKQWFRVNFSGQIVRYEDTGGGIDVMASDEDEAKEIALGRLHEIEWDDKGDDVVEDITLDSVEPIGEGAAR